MQNDPNHGGLDRRGLIHAGVAATLTALAFAGEADAAPVEPAQGTIAFRRTSIRFVDLTHKLTKAFNFGQSTPRIDAQPIDGSGKAAGMRLNRLSLNEHTGTHIDAPNHFDATARSLGEIPISDLVVPLVVVDARDKLAADGNYALQPGDIERWERRHGRLPAGCCVAIRTGFDPLAPRIPSAVPRRPANPGFSPAIVDTLIRQRSVKGVAVDSMNIDTGDNVPAYPFHRAWLSSGRWGIEGLANLGDVPESGALLFVGAPPIEGSTGIPIRAIALF